MTRSELKPGEVPEKKPLLTTSSPPEMPRHSLAISYKSMVSKSAMSKWADEEGLTVFAGVLAILSTIVGGGIVGLPYSYLVLGIPLAVVLNIAVVLLTRVSGDVYLRAKDNIPD